MIPSSTSFNACELNSCRHLFIHSIAIGRDCVWALRSAVWTKARVKIMRDSGSLRINTPDWIGCGSKSTGPDENDDDILSSK
jgi:hypothetical protein